MILNVVLCSLCKVICDLTKSHFCYCQSKNARAENSNNRNIANSTTIAKSSDQNTTSPWNVILKVEDTVR